jgi:hypothetical protein
MRLRDFLNTIKIYAKEYQFEVECPNGMHMTFKEAWAIPQYMQDRNIRGKVEFISYSNCCGEITGMEIDITLE